MQNDDVFAVSVCSLAFSLACSVCAPGLLKLITLCVACFIFARFTHFSGEEDGKERRGVRDERKEERICYERKRQTAAAAAVSVAASLLIPLTHHQSQIIMASPSALPLWLLLCLLLGFETMAQRPVVELCVCVCVCGRETGGRCRVGMSARTCVCVCVGVYLRIICLECHFRSWPLYHFACSCQSVPLAVVASGEEGKGQLLSSTATEREREREQRIRTASRRRRSCSRRRARSRSA